MNTLKSAALVIVLAGVLYGVYVTLHQPPAPPPPGMTKEEVDAIGPPEVEVAAAGSDRVASASSAFGEKSPAAIDPASPDSSAYGPPQNPSETLPPAPGAGLNSAHAASPDGHGSDQTRTILNPSFLSGAAKGGEVNLTAANFKRDWLNATYQVEEGKFREALTILTPYYHSPDLDAQSQAQLTEWLDALAAKVIYSREHLLESPHVVQSERERLVDIARQHGVTAQLLASINYEEIRNPDILIPTTKLKMVPGPFRAEVDLARSEMTVFLGNLYAGRFPFSLGDEPPAPGEYQVQQTLPGRTYHGDRSIPAGESTNPYGQWWIDLGQNACIHGSPTTTLPGKPRGCISLSPQDAQDMAAILAVGSKVVVRR